MQQGGNLGLIDAEGGGDFDLGQFAPLDDALRVREDVEVIISRQPEWLLVRLLGNRGL